MSDESTPSVVDVAPKRKRGCRGCALGCLSVMLALGLIVVLVLGYVLNWPRQWGWTEAPAEKLFAASPNPWAAEAILAELKAQQIPVEGTTVYVMPSTEGTGALAYVLCEDARGAAWRQSDAYPYRSATEGLLVAVARTKAATRYHVTRVAVDHRDDKGVQAAVMTVPTDVAVAHGEKRISDEEFLAELKGNADMTGFMKGMGE